MRESMIFNNRTTEKRPLWTVLIFSFFLLQGCQTTQNPIAQRRYANYVTPQDVHDVKTLISNVYLNGEIDESTKIQLIKDLEDPNSKLGRELSKTAMERSIGEVTRKRELEQRYKRYVTDADILQAKIIINQQFEDGEFDSDFREQALIDIQNPLSQIGQVISETSMERDLAINRENRRILMTAFAVGLQQVGQNMSQRANNNSYTSNMRRPNYTRPQNPPDLTPDYLNNESSLGSPINYGVNLSQIIQNDVDQGYWNRNRGSSNTIGNSTFYQDGTSTNQIGSTKFNSGGISSNQIGNYQLNSDGTSSNRIGNYSMHSDGGSSVRIGNSIFHSDGSYQIEYGK